MSEKIERVKEVYRKIMQARFVERKIRNLVIEDVVRHAMGYYNEKVEVSTIWNLHSCEIWIKVGNEAPVWSSTLYDNNKFVIKSPFRHIGFGKILSEIYDVYNFTPIIYVKKQDIENRNNA